MLETGKPFVNFTLQNQDGKQMKLGDFAGKWLVVYVYPEGRHAGMHHPGQVVHREQGGFRRGGNQGGGRQRGRRRVAQEFRNKFAFTIDLLADTNRDLLKAAGVGQTDYNGTKYWNRTSFVIDPKGNLRKVYEKVNPQGHEKVLLDDIKAMQKG